MPPRRSTRATSSSLLFDGSSEAGGPLDSSHLENVQAQAVHTAVGRGMSPGPARYSSSYGSPPTIMPTRQNVARQRYNFSSALSHVVDAVELDNENDARERAQREAQQQQRSRSGPENDHTGLTTDRAFEATSLQNINRPADETLESIELVREPSDDFMTGASETSTQRRATDKPQTAAKKRASRRAPASQAAEAPQPLDETPPPDFTVEDQVFAEAQIFTPVLPARRASVVSKTSSILQSILNSARRISTMREVPDDEAVRQAYPQFSFIRPKHDYDSDKTPTPEATTNGAARPQWGAKTTAEAKGHARNTNLGADARTEMTASTTPAAAIGRGVLRSIQARIATQGAGLSMRNRKNLFNPSRDPSQDELASNDNEIESTVTAKTAFGRRRSTRLQVQPVIEEKQQQQEQQRQPQQICTEGQTEPTSQSPPVSPKLKISKRLWSYFWNFGEFSRVLAMGITFLFFSAVALRVFVISTSPNELYQGYRVDNRLHWYGNDWRSNLRQLIPYALVHPLGAISDEEFARVNGLILSHASEVAQMKYADRLHSDALERINRILPAMVHMELDRRGRPVITQEFWHALKDTIHADKDIFNLIWTRDGAMTISDLQWTALKRQLQLSGLLPDSNTKALSVLDVEGIASGVLSKSWESWLQQNQKKLKDLLGVVAADHKATTPSPPSQPIDYDAIVDRLPDHQIAKLARHLASSSEAKQVLLSRQDFLQLLQNSFVEHRLEIKGEIADLESRVVEIARVAASAVSSVRSSPSESLPSTTGSAGAGNMSKREIMTLVDQLVRKGISDAQLEAMARGRIKAHWDSRLVKKVNFFSQNQGAVVHPDYTSPLYKVAVTPLRKLNMGVRGHSRSREANGNAFSDKLGYPAPGSEWTAIVFENWEEDRDCWCGATKSSRYSQSKLYGSSDRGSTDIGIRLGLRVLPQYLVLEHISPTATLNAGATPKDLEIWMQITDYAQQQPLQDWSMSQFPDTDDNEPLLGHNFIKVGQFTYEANKGDSSSGSMVSNGAGDAQVFRLSSDLETLDATTDFFVIRAVTNYGNQDHTCFYRLRLYGEHRPDVVER
ncbi:hypothetical protein SEPCBS57363_002975 [Sporothrix epigloea]|uniref:SUN domain-containing protein n=1 Tax=Sporothrix epigloea TaxID=1892477 RepID=A0ABP0DIW2_9PEZI